ncbi:chemotaxis protein CheX [Thermodesulfobacteriota bacterium]
MPDRLKHILSRVAEEMLGELAFIFSFSDEETEPVPLDDAVAASITFTGPFSGSFVIVVPDRVLPGLTENMLGLDGGETATLDQQHDALKETINVICGNILPVIFGKQMIFDMGTPKMITESAAIQEAVRKEDKPEPASSVSLILENGQCDLFLFVDGEIPAGADGVEPD